jgi:hypothetical protein
MNNELERMREEALRQYTGICLKGLRKSRKNISYNKVFPAGIQTSIRPNIG